MYKITYRQLRNEINNFENLEDITTDGCEEFLEYFYQWISKEDEYIAFHMEDLIWFCEGEILEFDNIELEFKVI